MIYENNRPLTAAEVQAHPEFPYITWDLKPQSSGKLSVAKTRGGPLDIAWEVHGEGENKMVVSVSFLSFRHEFYVLCFHSCFCFLKEGNCKNLALYSVQRKKKHSSNSSGVDVVDNGTGWAQDLMAKTNQGLFAHKGVEILVFDC